MWKIIFCKWVKLDANRPFEDIMDVLLFAYLKNLKENGKMDKSRMHIWDQISIAKAK